MTANFVRHAVALSALALIPATTAAVADADASNYAAIGEFMDVFQKVRSDYVDKVDDEKLIRGAISGMLASLDPHSNYLDESEYQNLSIKLEGSYGGLGLSVTLDDGAVKIIAPIEDTPGYRAGLKSGDYITHINGELIYDVTLDEAVAKMRGPAGTPIKLTIVRPGRDKPFDVDLVREKIDLKPVKWEVKNGVGIININEFSANTGADVKDAVRSIARSLGRKPIGYILDLRSNPGGILGEAVGVSGVFLDGGEVVSDRGRNKGDIHRYYADRNDDTGGAPVIVLIDGGSASASEIVAGALQDHHRALVMGERSFGKGSVQTVIPISETTGIKLTTSRYYTPSGRSIQEGGIRPDVRVPQLSDPDYKSRPQIRESDLRRHLLNETKAADPALEEDSKADPRFSQTPDQLKAKGITDFQLSYALQTISRLGEPPAKGGAVAATEALKKAAAK
ncbi:MAG: S41 family peptidase [Sphingobium sp.]|jgi:carboxyl-terminal processing protease|nr:S41 family peptidase [Sphingobium sp.]MCI1270613.1 S41 family peptidase [Sphingobium sp.]MCI1757198.1 S41 family peptidase [Sphingobium sp.]MCI2052713.1 S41 family peptidase [Sphingobium sp.]